VAYIQAIIKDGECTGSRLSFSGLEDDYAPINETPEQFAAMANAGIILPITEESPALDAYIRVVMALRECTDEECAGIQLMLMSGGHRA